MRDKVARSLYICEHGREPGHLSPLKLAQADAAISAILAELETPSVEMVEACCDAFDANDPSIASFAGVKAAIQAIAAHFKERA